MPKRTDIKKILLLGSGPIVIGQACEFDYSGAQACKALREEGYEIVLVNSNPATIMTDPEFADHTYIEPLTPEFVEAIIEKERPCAILPTLGGQTALNLAMKLYENGVLAKYHVQMLGADYDVIRKAEDRQCFKQAVLKIGLDVPRSAIAYNLEEAWRAVEEIGFPVIIRPSYTLGGTGGGFSYGRDDFEKAASRGIESSMVNEIIIEESIAGWKEYELEVMRDKKDNVVIVCSIENLDSMGVHTGDSITVAPIQTLTDKEYQMMRDAAIAIIREIGVETGGSNIQFAINPEDGRMIVIEMNPRVSRSSALASKATGFPIAKFAAKLAVGYSLDEIQNDITRETPASFEPAIDYCVVKIPRFTFEKFPEARDSLGVQMKSVGETMAIGRTFKEAMQKGLRGLEIGHSGFDNKRHFADIPDEKIEQRLREANASRIFYVKYALQKKWSLDRIFDLSKIDRWFLAHLRDIVDFENELVAAAAARGDLSFDQIRKAKEYGFSDPQLAEILNVDEVVFRERRKGMGVRAVFKLVDTCAAEFEAYTPYFYSTYETEDEAAIQIKKMQDAAGGPRKKIMILGGGPNRIGQGIEFDYCCVHAAFAMKDMGFETIMVNSNPETVSTDYDISDRLYFEPLTFEDVMNIVDVEQPDGVIVQFGGQTPLNLARRLHEAGVPIIGTSVDAIEQAENRELFSSIITGLGISQPANGFAYSVDEALAVARRIGFPVLVRPSFVLGGRAMKIVYDEEKLAGFISEAKEAARGNPILIDKFINDAIEVDVDAISDGAETYVAGIMEHIESAGIHSGDSACTLPPPTISGLMIKEITEKTRQIAGALRVIGLLNIQFAIKDQTIYVLEVNPRASRTVPFVSKATGVPLAKIAAQVMAGKPLRDFDINYNLLNELKHFAVKESVLPFNKFSGVDIVLGPEMKSTGEVMGIARTYGEAFAKSQISANSALPVSGKIFVSVKDADKPAAVRVARKFSGFGFELVSTPGTARMLRDNGIDVQVVGRYDQGQREGVSLMTLIEENRINLIVNTPSGESSQYDMRSIRAAAILHNVPCITTMQGAWAAVNAMETKAHERRSVQSIQDYYKTQKDPSSCAVS
jgi:carbamoyl-phosphate synthase large subunit